MLTTTNSKIIAYPYHWQEPARTEMAAYEAVLQQSERCDFDYIGFPWATIIDGLKGRSKVVPEILMALGRVPRKKPGIGKRLTVAQHIHALQFLKIFQAVGITDIYWSHATKLITSIDGIRLHPFPLYPAQTKEDSPSEQPVINRKYLANFIGAYNPNIYLTNVRQLIFEDSDRYSDLHIIKREAWHFDRVVYDQQIMGMSADEKKILLEKQHTEEYLQAIRDSWFTLCPSGSGPNSIRLFESLCLGSIPIVLTKDLRLPGPRDLWDKAAIIEEDAGAGYLTALEKARALTISQRIEMLKAGRSLYNLVSPKGFFNLIANLSKAE